MTQLRVVSAGLSTTVQDLGRTGWARWGVPTAGALDPAALVAANRCVGNPAEAAGLECVLRGPALVADGDVLLAVVGAGWAMGPVPVAAGVPYHVVPPAGLRCWVAVSGGIDTEPLLGSRSTDTLSGLGGTVLADGDVLALGTRHGPPAGVRPGPALPDGQTVLRVTPGPYADRLLARLEDSSFTVGVGSDRTALRFDGDPLPHVVGEIATIGVLPGAVQLPPGGQPIVLLGNAGTTGGYPVVAVVCTVDLRLAVQLRPGAAVRMSMIDVTQARRLTAQAAD